MTSCSESRKEAAGPTPLLNTRTALKIGTWNVRTMFDTGRTVQVARERKVYGLQVLGLNETRWLGMGQMKLATGEQLIYSGHTEDGATHTEGVAFMLSSLAQQTLVGWEPVSPRIVCAQFLTRKKEIKLNVIQCYAPTNDADEDKKDTFYQQLQDVIDSKGNKDITIVMGDFNAKIGADNTGYEDTMGTHGLGQMNENGERLADMCALNQLVIGGSIFPRKRIHKATWRSPDHVTENQIDHICINQRFRRSCKDVRVMRGADVASDHHRPGGNTDQTAAKKVQKPAQRSEQVQRRSTERKIETRKF